MPAKGCVWPVIGRHRGRRARGDCPARRCGSVAAFCTGIVSVMRFCCNVLPSVHACHCGSVAAFCLRFTPVIAVLLQRFAFGSRLLFDAERQTGRLAVSCVPIPRVEIAIRAFSRRSSVICLCGFTSGLAVSLWRSRRGYRGRGNAGNGVGGAAFMRFCASTLAL